MKEFMPQCEAPPCTFFLPSRQAETLWVFHKPVLCFIQDNNLIALKGCILKLRTQLEELPRGTQSGQIGEMHSSTEKGEKGIESIELHGVPGYHMVRYGFIMIHMDSYGIMNHTCLVSSFFAIILPSLKIRKGCKMASTLWHSGNLTWPWSMLQ